MGYYKVKKHPQPLDGSFWQLQLTAETLASDTAMLQSEVTSVLTPLVKLALGSNLSLSSVLYKHGWRGGCFQKPIDIRSFATSLKQLADGTT